MSTAEAEADLPALIAEVADGHSRILIEQEGRPVAALIGVAPSTDAAHAANGGALALVGAAGNLSDDEIDAMVEAIYAQRDEDRVRPVAIPE